MRHFKQAQNSNIIDIDIALTQRTTNASIFLLLCFFLDASSHLYMRVGPSVRPSDRLCVCPLPLRENRRDASYCPPGLVLLSLPSLFIQRTVRNCWSFFLFHYENIDSFPPKLIVISELAFSFLFLFCGYAREPESQVTIRIFLLKQTRILFK